jgi:hypothetical protein
MIGFCAGRRISVVEIRLIPMATNIATTGPIALILKPISSAIGESVRLANRIAGLFVFKDPVETPPTF